MAMVTSPETALATERFEKVYREADGDAARIPWSEGRASSALVNWLNAAAPSRVRCGARVLVVGCGLGDDARALISRGYDVTAFDCSESAIECARRADPSNASCYVLADLFDPPAKWRHRFDLVVEVNMLPMLKPDLRETALRAMAGMLSPHGHLLMIGQGTETVVEEAAGPPWPLTGEQLTETAARAGMVTDGVSEFTDEGEVRRYRVVFRK